MKYNFDKIINRKGTNCIKWDFKDVESPMWVADMDFEACPAIVNSLNKRLEHKVFGYSKIPDELYEAYIDWWDRRYNIQMKKEEMTFAIGVMPAITSIIRKFSEIGDNILIQTPVYHVFSNVILNNNRNIAENKLIYENNEYSIDFKDLEEKLSNPKTKIILLCNPHNPIGKIWNKEDIEKIGKLALKHNVLVVSDEIHCDLTDPGKIYVPFNSIENKDIVNNSITCISPSKTFNIAGLQNAMVFSKNKELIEKTSQQLLTDFFSGANSFSINGAIAAYNHGEEWLEELKQYLFQNKKIVSDFIKKELPMIKLVNEEATYLLWLDCEKLNMDSEELSDFLIKEAGLFLSPGFEFGENGNNFLRMNIACPKELLYKGLNSLKKGVELIQSKKE